MKGTHEDLESMKTFLMNFNYLDSMKVSESYFEEGKECWRLSDSMSFEKEELPGTNQRAAASIAGELTTVGLPPNMPPVRCEVSGSIQFNEEHGINMALQDLRAFDLESDMDSKRMLLKHRSIKREFSDRMIEFKKDSVLIGQYVIPLPDVK